MPVGQTCPLAATPLPVTVPSLYANIIESIIQSLEQSSSVTQKKTAFWLTNRRHLIKGQELILCNTSNCISNRCPKDSLSWQLLEKFYLLKTCYSYTKHTNGIHRTIRLKQTTQLNFWAIQFTAFSPLSSKISFVFNAVNRLPISSWPLINDHQLAPRIYPPIIYTPTQTTGYIKIQTATASNRLHSSQPFPVLQPSTRATITFNVGVGANSYTQLHTGEWLLLAVSHCPCTSLCIR